MRVHWIFESALYMQNFREDHSLFITSPSPFFLSIWICFDRASSLQSMVFCFSADLPLELTQPPFANLLINLYLSNLHNFLKRLVFARKFVSKPDQ